MIRRRCPAFALIGLAFIACSIPILFSLPDSAGLTMSPRSPSHHLTSAAIYACHHTLDSEFDLEKASPPQERHRGRAPTSIRNKTRVIAYDVFKRGEIIYLVSTYLGVHDPLEISVNMVRMSECGINSNEPVRYFWASAIGVHAPYEFTVDRTTTYIFQEIDDVSVTGGFQLIDESWSPDSSPPRATVGFATLFNADVSWIPRTAAVYRKQGVTHFWLYFNGPALPPDLPIEADIEYRIWPYPYWNDASQGCVCVTNTSNCVRDGSHTCQDPSRWLHAAQMGFLTTVRLRHMHQVDWLILADLDEWMVVADPSRAAWMSWLMPAALDEWHDLARASRSRSEWTLADFLVEMVPSTANAVIVKNHWARYHQDGSVVYESRGQGWGTRTKCVYKGRHFPGMLGIHGPKPWKGTVLYRTEAIKMFHLVDVLHPERSSATRFDGHWSGPRGLAIP